MYGLVRAQEADAATRVDDRGYARHWGLITKRIIPLPPLAEQKRIVAKVEALMNEVDTIERETKNLNRQFAQTRENFLDLVIRGKLVPQDPNDEPASELLKHVNAEKAALIKSVKLKKKGRFPRSPKTKSRSPSPPPGPG